MGRKTSAAKSSKNNDTGSTGKESTVDSKSWATQQQRQFLWDRFDTYMAHVPSKKYQPFWTMLEKEWKDRWPEIATEFSGRQEHELTAMELEKLAKAEEKRLKQLQTWFRWRAPPMHERDLQKQHTKLDDAIDALICRQRALRPYEMYSHMYRERFEEELQAQYQAHPEADPGERLKIWRSVAQDCYANEEDDIKKSVMDELEESAHRRRKGKEATNTPESYLQAIKDLNAVLARYLDVLAARTGWSFTIVMGGPHPMNQGGAIEVMSHSVGASYKNKFFPDAMIGFEETVMQPWLSHLKLVYPPEVCAERALSNRPSTSELDAGALLAFESSPTADDQPGVEALATGNDEDGLRAVASNRVDGDGDDDGDGREETTAVHTPTSVSTNDGALLAFSATATSHSDSPASIDQSTTSTSLASLFASSPQRDDQSTSTSNVMSFTDFLAASPHMDDVGLSLGSIDQLTYAANASDTSGYDFSGLFNYSDCTQNGSGLGDFSLTFPDMFNDTNNGNLAAGNVGAPASWSQPGLSNSAITSNLGLSEGGTTSTTALTSVVLPLPAPLIPSASTITPSVVTHEPITGPRLPASPLGTLSVNSTLPPAKDTNISNTNLQLISQVTNPPIVTSQFTTSRGRQVKPSQSAELMNRIGSAAGSILPGKENIPPSTTDDWLTPAKEYLEKQDLGEDWAGCITAWLALEGNPKKKNGNMPLPKQRPEEWTKWVTKTLHGRRGGYNEVPPIESAAEFGSAIMKWWHNIQPSFRQSADSNHPVVTVTPPAETTNDIWAPLRKNGPNGLVIVLILLSWWGHAAKRHNVWEDDSTPVWQKTVADVRRVLEALLGGVGSGVKRPGDDLAVQKKKRRTG